MRVQSRMGIPPKKKQNKNKTAPLLTSNTSLLLLTAMEFKALIMEIISRWPWPTVDNVFSCLDSNKLPLSHIASWVHLCSGELGLGEEAEAHLKLCMENNSCTTAMAVHTSDCKFFSLSRQNHLPGWKR